MGLTGLLGRTGLTAADFDPAGVRAVAAVFAGAGGVDEQATSAMTRAVPTAARKMRESDEKKRIRLI